MEKATGSPLLFRLAAFGLAAVLGHACGFFASESYELPAGYSGWVFVGYGVPACPPLPEVGGEHVLRVPLTGRLCTSSPMNKGFVRITFYERTGAERVIIPQAGSPETRRVWSQMTGEGGINNYRTRAFFVGTLSEHEAKPFEREGAGEIPWDSMAR